MREKSPHGASKLRPSASAVSRLATSASRPRIFLRFWYWPNDDSTVRRMVAMSCPVASRSATEP